MPVGNQRRKIRLEVRDNASNPRLAAQQATQLATRDKVHALLGGALARRDMAFRCLHRYGRYRGFAPYASDALTLIVEAARAADSLDRGRIRAYLRTQAIDGMVGPYAFEPSRHSGLAGAALGIYTVTNGSWNRFS